jgi:hypothetical protein
MKRVRVVLENIPTEGSAKWVAVSISALTIALGIYLAVNEEQERRTQLAKGKKGKSREDQDAERARHRLVTEIASLDKARAADEIGPKAYARIREALLDALARLMTSSA